MNTTVPTLDQLDAPTRNGLDAVTSAISKGWLVEHTADDHHSTIHATGSISERGRSVAMGEWINVPFSKIVLGISGAGNSWVNVAPTTTTRLYQLSYILVGKTMWISLFLVATNLTVASATGLLTVGLPPGFRVGGVSTGSTYVGRTTFNLCVVTNSGTQAVGILGATAGDTSLQVSRVDAANFVTDASFVVVGQIAIEVEAV